MTESDATGVQVRLSVLRRSRGLLILFCASAMLSSLALTYIYSERYRATTTVIYRPTDSIRLQNRQSQSLGFPVPMLPFEVIGQTISQIGTSEVIMREVVGNLGLDKPDTKRRAGFAYYFHETKKQIREFGGKAWQVLKYGRVIEENRTSAAIVDLAKNTTIDAERKDYTARIEVVDKDPERAAKIVDEIGRVLVKFIKTESVSSARRQYAELESRTVQTKSEMDALRKELEEVKTSRKLVSYTEEMSLNLKSIDEFERQMRDTEKRIAQAKGKLKAIESQKATLTPMIKSSETVKEDPVHDKLREMKAEREARLEGLLKRFPIDHPDVLMLQAELKATCQELAGLSPTRVGSQTTQINELHQKVLADEMETRAELTGLEAARESLNKSLAELRQKTPEPAVETRLEDLRLKLVVLETNYRQLATAKEDARIAELQGEGEIRVLHPATPQDAPFRPIKIYHVLVSGLLALMLGVGVACVVDFWRSLAEGQGTSESRSYGC